MKHASAALAICGHSKHGKSTLVGRLLADTGAFSEEQIQKIWEGAASQIRGFDRFERDFNRYNLLLLRDQTETAIDPSRTAYTTRSAVKVGRHNITVLDQPGHWQYVDNLVYGLYLADLAVVVIDAKEGLTSSTSDLFKIIKALQIPLAAISITKMDRVGFSQAIFDQRVEEIGFELIERRFEVSPPVVPTAALADEGLRASGNLSWYRGDELADVIRRSFERYETRASGPTRFAVDSSFTRSGHGTIITGSLESGRITAGDELIVQPASFVSPTPRSVVVRGLASSSAVGGDSFGQAPPITQVTARAIVDLILRGVSKEEAVHLFSLGAVLGRTTDPPRVGRTLEAEMVFFRRQRVSGTRKYNFRGPGGGRCVARVTSLQIAAATPPHDLEARGDEFDVEEGEVRRAILELERPQAIEIDQLFPRLCRFAFVESNEVIAAGRSVKIID